MTETATKQQWQQRAREIRYPTGHFLDGEQIAGGAERFTVINPATGYALVRGGRRYARADIDRAVASGRRAFESAVWRRMAPRDRHGGAAALRRG